MSSYTILPMITCEGCSLRLNILRRKRKCADCGFIFCSDCASVNGRFNQCYRCRVFTCVPLNCSDVASLRLRDLQWYLDTKGIAVPSNDRREKPVLVDWVMNYSRQRIAASAEAQRYQSIYPNVPPVQHNIGGLFRNDIAPSEMPPPSDLPPPFPTDQNDIFNSTKKEEKTVTSDNKHQIIDLNSVESRSHIFELTNMELKVLLTRNFISFRGCCEKSELQERVCWLWDIKEAAKSKSTTISDENLCKICMESAIDSLLLDCGHMVTCTNCGKYLHDCPICRQIIVRVVRAFRS